MIPARRSRKAFFFLIEKTAPDIGTIYINVTAYG